MTRKIRCIIVKLQQICSYCTCNFYQSLDSCANQCQKTKKVGKRFLKCCSFEWSKKEQRCRLHTSCPTDAPRNMDFLTCRKEGQSLFPKQLFNSIGVEVSKAPTLLSLSATRQSVVSEGMSNCPLSKKVLDIGHCPTKSWT